MLIPAFLVSSLLVSIVLLGTSCPEHAIATPAPLPPDTHDLNVTVTTNGFYVICDAEYGCRSEQYSSAREPLSQFERDAGGDGMPHVAEDPSVFLAAAHDIPTQPPYRRRQWSPGLAYHGEPGEPYVPRSFSPSRLSTLANEYNNKDVLPDAPNDDIPFSMTLVHTNDIHAHYEEYSPAGTDCLPEQQEECMGGIARLRTVIERVRRARKHVYLVDAGDQFQGTLFHNYFRGNASAAFMNTFGYDVFSLGNHEFDEGVGLLARFVRMLGFPTLACNMDMTEEPGLQNIVFPFTVLTKNGVRLGVIGYITPTTGEISRTGPNLRFHDPIPYIQQAIDSLHLLGVRKIIAVAHNGYAEDQHVAANTRGLSLIVGGHSHTLLESNGAPGAEGPYPTVVRNLDGDPTFIVQAKAWGEWVGVLDLDWDARGKLVRVRGQPVHLTSKVPKHAPTQQMVDAWRKPFDEWSKQVVGQTARQMVRDTCRWGSCALGNLVADALRSGYLQRAERVERSRPVFSLMNTGGLRADMPKGAITMGEVTTILPFSNEMVCIQVSGAFVLELLENLVSDVNPRTGHAITSFAQTSGLYATLDMTRPERERVVDAWILAGEQREVVDPLGTYTMVTLDYIAEGGDQMLPEFFPHGQLALMGDVKDHVIRLIKQVKVVLPDDELRLKVVVDEEHPWVRGHL